MQYWIGRDGEGVRATATTAGAARNLNNYANNGLESEANTARRADVQSQAPPVNPDKASASPSNTPGTPTAASARTEENVYQERAALLGKVDMELFQWPKFVLSLSRKEKEDDFLAIKGVKLPIRPKKRIKNVERVLHVSGRRVRYLVWSFFCRRRFSCTKSMREMCKWTHVV